MKYKFKNNKIVFLGFNNMLKHKRGVENVIAFQSKSGFNAINYYVHWDNKTSVYHYENFLCISIKNNSYKYFVLNWVLLKIKRRDKSSFIHSHNALMSMMSFFQTDLFTVHDALYYQNKAVKHRLKNLFYVLETFLYKRVNYVHFISEYAKKMSLFSSSKNFIIIPNTSHLEEFKERKRSVEKNRAMAKYQASSTRVFVVRSMEERSRIDLLIKVAAQQVANSSFEFIVAGKGPLYDFYKKQIETLNLTNIRLLGYVSDLDLIGYYSACDIVLMPAEFGEGFGLPIIEGYLFNKPVIASNKCAIPEVICSDEFLFENTVESIIEKLEYASSNQKIAFKEYYNDEFSNASISKRFNELYRSLVKC